MLKNVKIVFFDIDSTLYDRKKSLPESTLQAISALQRNGIIAAIATGRAPFMFDKLKTALNIHTFISYNGTYIVYEDHVIHKQALPENIVDELTRQSTARGHQLVYENSTMMKISGRPGNDVITSLGSLKLSLPLPQIDPDYYKTHDIYQILLFYSEQDDVSYLAQAPLNHLRYVRWHPQAVDVMPKNVSKAAGVRRLLDALHLSSDQAAAFGDGYNDVEMLSYVGTGVAMGNAVAEAKDAADFVTRDVDRDGIYYGLKETGLI